MNMPPGQKIVVIGPESTGKSTLCEMLAAHFQTQWVPEYAREYLVEHGMNYTFSDLLTIAKGQLAQEEKIAAEMEEGLLFIDTDMYVMKVWCEFVFNQCHQWIIDQIALRRYDFYLLCNTDLPWAPDPLREYPDLESREELFHIYKDLLQNQSTPWVEITGGASGRLPQAIQAIDKWSGTL